MTERFKVEWEVYDGYCGGSRPQAFYINAHDLEEDMDERDLVELYNQSIRDDAENKVSFNPRNDNQERFLAWAQSVIAAKDE